MHQLHRKVVFTSEKSNKNCDSQGSRDHTNKLFIKLQTLKFNDLVKFKLLQMWKVKNNLVPLHIQNKFMLITDSNNRRKGYFCVPYSRTSQKKRVYGNWDQFVELFGHCAKIM